MSPSVQSGRGRPKRDSTALALLVAMICAVAVTGGASLSAVGSGEVQRLLHSMGFGRDSEIQAAQRKQAASLAELERIVNRMDNEIGGLTTRIGRTETGDATVKERLSRLDGNVAAINTDMRELRARAETAGGGEGWRKPVEHLNTAVTGTRSDIINLRSSLDAYESVRRSDIGALNKRIDRLEQALTARDATSSIPAPALQPEPETGLRSFFGLRGSGESRGHVIDMGSPGN
jgi:chromosome segregation ATPase